MKKKLLARLLALLLGLGVAEIAARLLEPVVYAPGTQSDEIVLPPVSSDLDEGEEAIRVFVYGGSTSAGANHGPSSFVSQLEFWLARYSPGQDVEIRNYAHSGKASSFVRGRIKDSIGLAPDVLVVLTGHNEHLQTFGRDEFYVIREGIDRFALVRLAKLFAFRARIAQRLADNGYDTDDTDVREDREEVVGRYRENLTAIVHRAREAGVPLVLVTPPSNVAAWPPSLGEGVDENQRRLALDSLRHAATGTAREAVSALRGEHGKKSRRCGPTLRVARSSRTETSPELQSLW